MGKLSLKAMRESERLTLRERILDAAAALIARDGTEALTMRKLAQALDCSPMSLYSYFSAKHDLLFALAQRSFGLLAERFSRDQAQEPVAALRQLYMDFARFGMENPSEYRTMFMTPEAQPEPHGKTAPDLYKENPAFALGVDRVRACVAAAAFTGDPYAVATLLWTNVHGAVAALICLSAFPFGDPERYVARVIDLTLAAFRTQAIDRLT